MGLHGAKMLSIINRHYMIPSFQINHNKLQRGLYISREDFIGRELVITYDLRVCTPNKEQMTPEVAHTIEHLMADYLRNDALIKDSLIYFGPMGCMTGFYLIIHNWSDLEYLAVSLKEAFSSCITATAIPGNTAIECGNYKLHDLKGAKSLMARYLHEVLENLNKENTHYPD